MLTETEYAEHAAASRPAVDPHPICAFVRQLRLAARMTLVDFQVRYGIPAVVVGAYERGDRIPPLQKLDTILGCFGYQLQAVPIGTEAVRLRPDLIADLRAIANQLEAADAVQALSESTPEGGLPVSEFVSVSAPHDGGTTWNAGERSGTDRNARSE